MDTVCDGGEFDLRVLLEGAGPDCSHDSVVADPVAQCLQVALDGVRAELLDVTARYSGEQVPKVTDVVIIQTARSGPVRHGAVAVTVTKLRKGRVHGINQITNRYQFKWPVSAR